MGRSVVVDLDRVLLAGDASLLFLRGALTRAPRRLLRVLAAVPLLLAGSALPATRPLGARALLRLAAPPGGADDAAAAFRRAVAGRPGSVVAEAVACVRAHLAAGDQVVVATGCEETMARGYLAAIGLGDVEVVGSTGRLWPPRVRRAMGPAKVRLLEERGHPPPWAVVYSDSPSDVPLFSHTPRPVLVNAGSRAARRVAAALGREPETRRWS
ncbi:haloacid dehalogenase-like hydrolase [Blastococcus sp. SYSU D00820]